MNISKEVVKAVTNAAVCTVLSESPFNPLHHFSMKNRRKGYVFIVQKLFPSDYSDDNQSFQKADELVKEDYGTVVTLRHFSNRDFFMTMGLFCQKSTIIRGDKRVITPLAYHMYTLATKRLLEYFGVTPMPVVTEETVRKGKNTDPKGKALPEGTGEREYLKKGWEVLSNGGAVFVAPSRTRKSLHDSWTGRPVEALMRCPSDRVAVMSVGLDIPGIDSYMQRRGLNIGERYKITVGGIDTKQELNERVKSQGAGVTVDRVVAVDMAMLVRPQTLGESFRELREQRLSQS